MRVTTPVLGHQVAGDDAQQGRLAGAVRSDQRHLRAVADAERHVLEQHPAVGELEAHTGDVHVTHEESLSVTGPRGASSFQRRLTEVSGRSPAATRCGHRGR